MVMGTLRYMAPEQLAGQEVGPRVDLYGLGALLYEMLTGCPPHPGASPAALLRELSDGPPAMDGIDPTLASVVTACLQPRPESRPLHAGEVATALRAWLAGDPACCAFRDATPGVGQAARRQATYRLRRGTQRCGAGGHGPSRRDRRGQLRIADCSGGGGHGKQKGKQ